MWQMPSQESRDADRRPCPAGPRQAGFRRAGEHFVNGNRIQGPFPAGLEQAMFGLGCFWGAERMFWKSRASIRPPSAMPPA
jgi:peptide-methionine (S)-S-oxide reductase